MNSVPFAFDILADYFNSLVAKQKETRQAITVQFSSTAVETVETVAAATTAAATISYMTKFLTSRVTSLMESCLNIERKASQHSFET